MYPLTSRTSLTILLHVLTWMLFAFILLFYQPWSMNIKLPYQFWIKQEIILAILVLVFYSNSHILVPKLLLQKKNIVFVLVVLAILLLASPLIHIIEQALQLPLLMDKAFKSLGIPAPPQRGDFFDIFLIMMIALIIGISTSITLMQKWQSDRQNWEALEKEKIGAELSFLKAQINPHFFFNTLNNIYALMHVDVEKSKTALHKLSRMMRYLLYDSQAGNQPLSKELAFIVDYLDLMKIRLNATTTVIYKEPLIVHDYPVAAMLFLPYIENAFKHGVSNLEPSEISITFEMNGPTVHMLVKNSVFSSQGNTADEYGGIGLMNTKRRLELLYPGKHIFTSAHLRATKQFVVSLTLNLDDTKLRSDRR